jgi:exopolyphosphatase/guanosine-5'-triphosphate,3'-diphosphate pyrophosphatase
MLSLKDLLQEATFVSSEHTLYKTRRVGVVEVGSRAVRLLVADIFPDGRIKVICSRGVETYLAEAVEQGDEMLMKKCEEVKEIIESFCIRARERKVEKVAVFGTEAIRQLYKKDACLIRDHFPDMVILNKRAEAFCSFVAVTKSLPWVAPNGEDIFIIDQGGGSMELAFGRRTANKISMEEYKSYRLGTHELMGMLRSANGDMEKYAQLLDQKVEAYTGLASVHSGTRVVTLGSAATRMAWFTIRRKVKGNYSTSKVHGKVIEVFGMDSIVDKTKFEWNRGKRYAGFEKTTNKEFGQFVTGIAALAGFLKKAGKKRTVVSGWGTRYGFALLFAVSETI